MQWLARLKKLLGFSRKSGKSCESSQKSGKEKQSELMINMNPVEIAPEKADQQATQKVGCQGPEWKVNRGYLFSKEGNSIPCNRSYSPTQANGQYSFHGFCSLVKKDLFKEYDRSGLGNIIVYVRQERPLPVLGGNTISLQFS